MLRLVCTDYEITEIISAGMNERVNCAVSLLYLSRHSAHHLIQGNFIIILVYLYSLTQIACIISLTICAYLTCLSLMLFGDAFLSFVSTIHMGVSFFLPAHSSIPKFALLPAMFISSTFFPHSFSPLSRSSSVSLLFSLGALLLPALLLSSYIIHPSLLFTS